MKKFVTAFLAIVMIMSMVACGSEDEPAKKGSPAITDKLGATIGDAMDKGVSGMQSSEPEVLDDDYDPATHWDANPSELLWGGNFVMEASEEYEGATISVKAEVAAEDEYMLLDITAGDTKLMIGYVGSDCYLMANDQAYHYVGDSSDAIVDANLSLATFKYVETKDDFDVYDITEEGGESTQLLVNHDTRTTEKVVIGGEEFSISELTERSFSVDRLSDVQETTAEEAAALLLQVYTGAAVETTEDGLELLPEEGSAEPSEGE